jgi:hypothetical protein
MFARTILPWLLVVVFATGLANRFMQFTANQTLLERAARTLQADALEERRQSEGMEDHSAELWGAENDELERLRKEVAVLREKHEAQLTALRDRNQALQEEVVALRSDPATAQANEVFETSQLLQIAQAFLRYAELNTNRFPRDFSELQPYAPAAVFSALETSRYEIVAPADWSAVANPAQTALLRSKHADPGKGRLYLFADGHTETREDEA